MRVLAFVLVTVGIVQARVAIVDPVVSDFPGGTRVPESYVFAPGDKVYISFRLTSESAIRIEAVDARGRLLAPAQDLQRAAGPVERFIVLPDGLWPGDALFRVNAKADTETATVDVPFHIASDLAEEPKGLSIERFRFFQFDFDTEPLNEPVFGIGDTVWARFLLAGFAAGPTGEADVYYGVALRTNAGRQLMSEPQAMTDRRKSFYPRAYVPALVSIRLDFRIPKGEYIMVITAVDAIGKQKVRSEHPFRVQ